MERDTYLRKGLKLRHLRLLSELQDSGQLGVAADRMGIAQPAASRLLTEIEGIVGVPVRERQGRVTALTDAGAALARRAARMLIELADAEREVTGITQGSLGHVRIGSVTGPAMDRVLPVLRNLRLSQPDITSEVTVAPSDILFAQLMDGRLDFVLGRVPVGTAPGLCEVRPLETEKVALMVRRGHYLQGIARLEPRDLMAFDWVMPGEDAILGRTVLSRLAELGLPVPPRRLSTSSFLLTLAMVQQSNAIAPLAWAVATTFSQGPDAPYAVLPIDLGIEVEPFSLITRSGSTLPAVVRRVADMVSQPRLDGGIA